MSIDNLEHYQEIALLKVIFVIQEVILEQSVEKVSFCSPDRTNEKGFAYICRDSAAKRWLCHAFLTLKDCVS